MVEYGYTGHEDKDVRDANGLVNEYVRMHPEQSHRFLANIVGHTVVALEKWKCQAASSVSHFVTVYNDAGMTEGKHTMFGDDVIASDHLMEKKDGDCLVMLEGGMQSFKQAINVLNRDIPIYALTGIRTEKGKKGFFSASDYLGQVSEALKVKPDFSTAELRTLTDEYLKTRQAWDPAKGDAPTKAALFEASMREFISEGAYKKLATSLFTLKRLS
jgi:hypothetical protein